MPHRRYKMSYKKTWSYHEVSALISKYRSMPCLWEVNSPYYKDRNRRNECLTAMALQFNTSPAEISRKIHNLRSQFHSERQKLLKRKSIYGSHHRCISKWPHFDSLRFLKKSITKRFREDYKELHEPVDEPNYNENPENIGGGTAEPTSTVNVKQEPVDITESEQEMLLVLMKDDNEMNDRMEAHSSRTEQHASKSEPQNSKSEAHCSKMDMHYSNCKPEACCSKHADSHFSRLEPYFGKTEVPCGLSDVHSNRSEIHSNRPDIHNSRSEMHINLAEPHSSRSEAHCSRTEAHCSRNEAHCSRNEAHCSRTEPHCSRTEPLCVLKIEPNTERVNRRSEHSETSPYMAPDMRRLAPVRNENRHPHCRHRSESISSTLLETPNFTAINEVPHSGNKREKHWLEEDQYEIFGKFVAAELRSLNSEYLKRKMKRKIQRAILDVCEEEDH